MSESSPVAESNSVQATLSRLFDERGQQLYSLGLRLCGNPQQAEDLVQETFLQAVRKWEQFEGRSDPATWLYAIAVRACKRFHRRRSGEPQFLDSISQLLPRDEATISDLASIVQGPDKLLLQREIQELVDQMVGTIPISFRLPLILKDIAEFSVEQVAAILGLKEETVKTRVYRARLFLRKKLAHELPQRAAPPPDHSRQVCLDLLYAKQEALDRGVDFPLGDEELCGRCRAVFLTLDLVRDACRQIGSAPIPPNRKGSLSANLKRVFSTTRSSPQP